MDLSILGTSKEPAHQGSSSGSGSPFSPDRFCREHLNTGQKQKSEFIWSVSASTFNQPLRKSSFSHPPIRWVTVNQQTCILRLTHGFIFLASIWKKSHTGCTLLSSQKVPDLLRPVFKVCAQSAPPCDQNTEQFCKSFLLQLYRVFTDMLLQDTRRAPNRYGCALQLPDE